MTNVTPRQSPKPEAVPVPPHLMELPRVDGRFIVPAEAPWVGDTPNMKLVCNRTRVVLAAHRACAVCGLVVHRDEWLWRLYPATEIRRIKRLTEAKDLFQDKDPLGHLVCMLYASLVCPHWRSSGARVTNYMARPGATRGSWPGLVGFPEYYLMRDPMTAPLRDPRGSTFMMPAERSKGVPFGDVFAEMKELYDTERHRIGNRYMDQIHERYHYAPDLRGDARLEDDFRAAETALDERKPEQTIVAPTDGWPGIELHMAGWLIE